MAHTALDMELYSKGKNLPAWLATSVELNRFSRMGKGWQIRYTPISNKRSVL